MSIPDIIAEIRHAAVKKCKLLALADAHEALEKERDEARRVLKAGADMLARTDKMVAEIAAERDRLKAEVERLKEKLDSYEDQDNPNSEEN